MLASCNSAVYDGFPPADSIMHRRFASGSEQEQIKKASAYAEAFLCEAMSHAVELCQSQRTHLALRSVNMAREVQIPPSDIRYFRISQTGRLLYFRKVSYTFPSLRF